MNEMIISRLLTSKKYRDICPFTLNRITEECISKYKKPKDVEKAVREKLHGITCAYLSEQEFKHALEYARNGEIHELLSCHASTRERMPVDRLDSVYDQITTAVGVPSSILDLACGLNPVYLKHRFPDALITGLDISGQCVRILRLLGIDTRHDDLLNTESIPADRYDMALLFKILPLLERQKSGAASALLDTLNARFVVISNATRSLSGRNIGMEENYSRMTESLIPERYRIRDRFTTDNELFYILEES